MVLFRIHAHCARPLGRQASDRNAIHQAIFFALFCRRTRDSVLVDGILVVLL